MVHSVGPGIWNDNIVFITDSVSNMFPAMWKNNIFVSMIKTQFTIFYSDLELTNSAIYYINHVLYTKNLSVTI